MTTFRWVRRRDYSVREISNVNFSIVIAWLSILNMETSVANEAKIQFLSYPMDHFPLIYLLICLICDSVRDRGYDSHEVDKITKALVVIP